MSLVDTGDFAAEPDEAGRLKTESLIEGMGAMGYDAVNLGARDLAVGIAAFRAMTATSKLAFTNANFVFRDSGEPLFPPYIIREHKLSSGRRVKVGYIGLDAFDSAFAKETSDGRVVVMRDPVEAARLHVPALRGKADLVVLLANLSLRDLTNALTAVKGIDLVLASYGARLSEGGTLETVAGVPVLYSGDQGKRLGEVRIELKGGQGPPVMAANQVLLTRRYPAEPKMQALIDKTVARVNDVNRMHAQRLASATAGTAPSTPPAAVGVRPGVMKDAGPPASAGKSYVTAMPCDACHAAEYEVYRTSAHARAFETLVKANQDFNPECVKCHVTGFREPGGFMNARQTPDLANVQCEACHGSAADHVSHPDRPFGSVPPRACFTCHTKDNSPDFVFYQYWNKIKH